MIISKAKGPAEAATSPSHGSTHPQKDKEMNRPEDTTAAPDAARDFPILYPSTAPEDDLCSARALLSILQDVLSEASQNPLGMGARVAGELFQLACVIVDRLDTLQWLFKDDEMPSMVDVYQRARRKEILARWGVRS